MNNYAISYITLTFSDFCVYSSYTHIVGLKHIFYVYVTLILLCLLLEDSRIIQGAILISVSE